MTNVRTIWHHATGLTDDEQILEVSPRLGIKWFAAPECARTRSPSGSTTRRVIVELPEVKGVPVVDVRDVAGSLVDVDHDLTEGQIEALQRDIDAMGYEADEAVAWLLDDLTGGRGLVLRNWESDGDEVLIVGERGLIDARILQDAP